MKVTKMYVSRGQRGIGPEIPLTWVSAESEEASRALVIRVWGVCGVWLAELIPQISPKNWRSMVERQNGPCEWSLPFSREPAFVTRPPQAKYTGWHEDSLKGLFTMNSRLFARAHTDGTWAYSRRTERKKKNVCLSTKSSRATADLYLLLTTGHAARLAASIFGPSSLGRVRSSGKRRCEIKRIAGGLRLRWVIRGQVMARGRAG
jgi:hypothetical protein